MRCLINLKNIYYKIIQRTSDRMLADVGSLVNGGFLDFIRCLVNRFSLNLNVMETNPLVEHLIECYMNNISQSRLYMFHQVYRFHHRFRSNIKY